MAVADLLRAGRTSCWSLSILRRCLANFWLKQYKLSASAAATAWPAGVTALLAGDGLSNQHVKQTLMQLAN